MRQKIISGWAWHQHHAPYALEWCFDYNARILEIENKPANEVPTRKRLFKMSREGIQVPSALDKAGNAIDKAQNAYDKARNAYDKARNAYDKAQNAYSKARNAIDKTRNNAYYKAQNAYSKAENAYGKALSDHRDWIETLHAQECGCAEWNGKEIVFPKG